VLTAGNLFTGRCSVGGSAYGFREELNLPNNFEGVGMFAGYPQLPLATMRKLTKILKLKVRTSCLAVQGSGSAI